MNLTPRIRPMVITDLEVVYALEQLCHPFPWSKGILQDCLTACYSCWVIEINEINPEGFAAAKTVGFAIMSIKADECHVLNICITPDRQGHGLGRLFMAHLLEFAKNERATMVFLEVRASNHKALKLYRSLGFNEISVRRDYYQTTDGREDAIMMALQLL